MIHPIRFFSIEKEQWIRMFYLECLIRHYINEFIRIINWNNLNETFQAYKKNYSIVTRKKVFFLWLWLFRQYRELTKILAKAKKIVLLFPEMRVMRKIFTRAAAIFLLLRYSLFFIGFICFFILVFCCCLFAVFLT